MSDQKLTAEHFYKFFQCPHWIWYDIYGDAEKRKRVPPLLDMIYKGKMLDAHDTLGQHKQFDVIKPELFRDLDEAFMATLELMKQGKNIYHGVLMDQDWVGMPDLLEARPGKSNFGNWEYVVYDAQSSLDLGDDYKFQLIFYSLILERLQGVRPKEGYVIDPQGNERSFLIDDYLENFHLTRIQIQKILNGEKPAPFLKSGCKRTPWYSICLEETQGCNDVSLIHKVSQADQRRFYEIGIKTVNDLANADTDALRTQLEDWPFDKIVRFSNQAKSLISNEIKILAKPNFPQVKNEIYFDIESDPTHDIDYLLGFLVRPCADIALHSGTKGQVSAAQRASNVGSGTYHSFFAKDKSEESEIWKKFLDFLTGLEDFVIYHYAYYERQVFDRLTLRYGAPPTLVNKFKENTIDLHEKLVDSVVLPLYFYSLKDVAGYFGYTWANPDAGGAESVVWYNEWLEKKDNEVLKKLERYNEDDVRATMLIKEWLVSQKPHKSREKLDEAI